jgi:excisionase family DNA binding protein
VSSKKTERLWGIAEVAEYLGIPVNTLYQWRHQGVGPRSRRVGRHLRYDPDEVRRWFLGLDSSGVA